jgi:hypothetical protein
MFEQFRVHGSVNVRDLRGIVVSNRYRQEEKIRTNRAPQGIAAILTFALGQDESAPTSRARPKLCARITSTRSRVIAAS